MFRFVFSCIRKGFNQSNTSLDTSEWPEGFCSPSVCKEIIFALTETQLSMDTCPIMEFVQKYSSQFQHVEIECIHSTEKRLIKRWCVHFKVFLHILTSNSQLISVKFLYLSNCFQHIDTPTYVDICRTISLFLESQHRLKRVEFRICSFRFNEGVELLGKLTENSRESLTHLVLVLFVRYEPMDKVISSSHDSFVICPSTAAQTLPSLIDFPSLKTLEIDYSFILENKVARQSTAIQTVKNCGTLVLSNLFIHYDNRRTPIEVFRGLTSTDWRFLKILCPDLQVELLFYTNSPSRRELEFIIVPNMPITQMTYLCDNFDMEMDTGVLFGHLLACKTNDHLVSLSVGWEMPIPDLAHAFPPFLQACRKLKCLDLSVSHPANGVDILMQSWLENRPETLEKVRINITEIEEEDEYANLMSLAGEFKLRGLNVNVNLYF
ncbi:hypothetical protein AVEN_91915-1 [Araneus ventricosus]|uniref:F-box domain-containing protein n=1 Tax=Araneus ventricosus TaxID=182803 RepID=A0A4Y2SRK2_ARAVE|nr:hypothetical protein AVEN_271348-1 [Araneus ventricosus]GBN90061.1 hypothetical protein AVEN_91915-1 [Araneus ventricosus]